MAQAERVKKDLGEEVAAAAAAAAFTGTATVTWAVVETFNADARVSHAVLRGEMLRSSLRMIAES